MKKFIFVAIFLLFLSSSQLVFAQEMQQGTESAEVLGVQTIDYTLPYPGLLPDNPLYFLKAFRDKIVSLVIADPIKKAEFDVLQADKRLEASLLLLQRTPRQDDLIITTLSKGENYFSDAIDQVTFAKKQGQDTTDILGKMEVSNSKHLEVIENMETLSSSSLKGKIDQQQVRVENLGKLVNAIQAKKK